MKAGEILNSEKTAQLLSNILEILEMMIESGAEIYRVEESATRALGAYDVKRVDVYATTSNIILSFESKDGMVKTHTRRIKQITTDIEKVHRLNALIRRITSERLDPAIIEEELQKIRTTPKYPPILTILFYGIIAGAFFLFFGGRALPDLLASLGIGLITGILVFLLDKIRANKFLVKFLCSLSACSLTFLLCRFSLISHVDYIIIGNIMTLIPGTGLTNSLRDLFTGDSISGVLRLIEAALLALAIACGYIVTLFMFGGAI